METTRERREQLEQRMLRFAGLAVDMVLSMPAGILRDVLGRQLLRSATSVGANYREANRAESRKDFVHKIAIAEKEAAESIYWIELCRLKNIGDVSLQTKLLQEANELTAILVTIGRRTKAKM